MSNEKNARKGGATRVSKIRARTTDRASQAVQEERQERILENRERATIMARALLKKWGAWIDGDDLQSIVDMALCEAAKHFRPTGATAFLSYAFYYIKGSLIQSISDARLRGVTGLRGRECEKVAYEAASTPTEVHGEHAVATSDYCPDETVMRGETRNWLAANLTQLSGLEQRVVCGVDVLEFKVAALARKLGYSRGHLSMIRQQAIRKMRSFDQDFPLAA